jgi:hypothetical protein
VLFVTQIASPGALLIASLGASLVFFVGVFPIIVFFVANGLITVPSSTLQVFKAEGLLSGGLAICPVFQVGVDIFQSHVVDFAETTLFRQVFLFDIFHWRLLYLFPWDSRISAAS